MNWFGLSKHLSKCIPCTDWSDSPVCWSTRAFRCLPPYSAQNFIIRLTTRNSVSVWVQALILSICFHSSVILTWWQQPNTLIFDDLLMTSNTLHKQYKKAPWMTVMTNKSSYLLVSTISLTLSILQCNRPAAINRDSSLRERKQAIWV